MKARGKRAALWSLVVGISVAVAGGYTLRERIQEGWYLIRLKGDPEYFRVFLDGKLTAIQVMAIRTHFESDPAFRGSYFDRITQKDGAERSQAVQELEHLCLLEEGGPLAGKWEYIHTGTHRDPTRNVALLQKKDLIVRHSGRWDVLPPHIRKTIKKNRRLVSEGSEFVQNGEAFIILSISRDWILYTGKEKMRIFRLEFSPITNA